MYDRLTKTITRWSYGGVLWSHDRRNLPGNIYTNPLCEQQAEGQLVRREVTNSAACLALFWVYYLKHQAYTDHILHKSFLGLDVQKLQKQQTCSPSTSPTDQPPVSPSKTTWRRSAALWALMSNQMWACYCRNTSDTCVTVESPTSWNPVWIGWHEKGFRIYFLRFFFLSSSTGQLFTHQTHPVCPSSNWGSLRTWELHSVSVFFSPKETILWSFTVVVLYGLAGQLVF